MPEPDSDLTVFQRVDTWLFDLDNTLYPGTSGLFQQVRDRMNNWLMTFFQVDADEAALIRRHHYETHGTTLRGLMLEHGIDPAPYLAHVHDIDLTDIAPNPALGAAIDALPGRKLIFTNATVAHAENVLGRLGFPHLFEAIFDIEAADYIPKPDERPYRQLLATHGVDPDGAVFFEDLDRNLGPADRLGMLTVLVDLPAADKGGGTFARPGQALGGTAATPPYIHFRTDDLTAFLEALPL